MGGGAVITQTKKIHPTLSSPSLSYTNAGGARLLKLLLTDGE